MENDYYITTAVKNALRQPTQQNNCQMNKRIKTNIKFQRRGSEDKLVGFITKKNGSWMGCRETDPEKKKIVIADYRLTKSLKENVLYQCSLIPMRNQDGFIAVSARLVQFKARIQTKRHKNGYCVKVVFGNKTILYDPTSASSCENDIQKIATLIKERVDLEDAPAVAEEFINSACLCRNMSQSIRVFKAC